MSGYIPHTDEDRAAMLRRAGVETMDDLFASVPAPLRWTQPLDIPDGMPEPEILRHAAGLAAGNLHAGVGPCFCGAGVYHHHVPSIIPAILQRGEFLTSYTPYQPERSQGLLQTIYEFQSLTCRLTGMDVANASIYDGATALAEAVNMAALITGRRRALIPDTVFPRWTEVVRTYARGSDVEVEIIPHRAGRAPVEAVAGRLGDDVAAVVIPQPNAFGLLEDVGALTKTARAAGALAIAAVNPIALAVLSPPGEWPADVAVAEGQPLGLPMSYGGPLLGLFACREEHMRQVPGRIVGATTDADGRRAYTLTLQTREQHIRREKASSNICTNQALCALGATVYLSLLGKTGLRDVAALSVQRAHEAFEAVTAVPGFTPLFEGPFFHEFAVSTPVPVAEINRRLAERGVIGPFDLSADYPDLGHAALFACTELIRQEDITLLTDTLGEFV